MQTGPFHENYVTGANGIIDAMGCRMARTYLYPDSVAYTLLSSLALWHGFMSVCAAKGLKPPATPPLYWLSNTTAV